MQLSLLLISWNICFLWRNERNNNHLYIYFKTCFSHQVTIYRTKNQQEIWVSWKTTSCVARLRMLIWKMIMRWQCLSLSAVVARSSHLVFRHLTISQLPQFVSHLLDIQPRWPVGVTQCEIFKHINRLSRLVRATYIKFCLRFCEINTRLDKLCRLENCL